MSDFHDSAINVKCSGRFTLCRWCRGGGCIACADEYARYAVERARPVFTARIDNEEEMGEMRRVIGGEALAHAFGPDGGGVAEILTNALVQTIRRDLRLRAESGDSGDGVGDE